MSLPAFLLGAVVRFDRHDPRFQGTSGTHGSSGKLAVQSGILCCGGRVYVYLHIGVDSRLRGDDNDEFQSVRTLHWGDRADS
jgi:hypothetical protein